VCCNNLHIATTRIEEDVLSQLRRKSDSIALLHDSLDSSQQRLIELTLSLFSHNLSSLLYNVAITSEPLPAINSVKQVLEQHLTVFATHLYRDCLDLICVKLWGAILTMISSFIPLNPAQQPAQMVVVGGVVVGGGCVVCFPHQGKQMKECLKDLITFFYAGGDGVDEQLLSRRAAPVLRLLTLVEIDTSKALTILNANVNNHSTEWDSKELITLVQILKLRVSVLDATAAGSKRSDGGLSLLDGAARRLLDHQLQMLLSQSAGSNNPFASAATTTTTTTTTKTTTTTTKTSGKSGMFSLFKK
jgi:hypothetical protein